MSNIQLISIKRFTFVTLLFSVLLSIYIVPNVISITSSDDNIDQIRSNEADTMNNDTNQLAEGDFQQAPLNNNPKKIEWKGTILIIGIILMIVIVFACALFCFYSYIFNPKSIKSYISAGFKGVNIHIQLPALKKSIHITKSIHLRLKGVFNPIVVLYFTDTDGNSTKYTATLETLPMKLLYINNIQNNN
ncbi:MAG: hypothetical protein OEZ01_10010 [Candidatus Heimdallarchaeota archaeon]|nr:hypothetical protein [Candidatus Heimdallarchaeota archaeon]MDH5646332.1 hypothetical protein [Candidatus Heimdallarchaeota archaeon]